MAATRRSGPHRSDTGRRRRIRGERKGKARRAVRDVPRRRKRARQGSARPHLDRGAGQRLCPLPRGGQLAALRRPPLPPVHRRPGTRHAARSRREAPPHGVRQRTQRGAQGFPQGDAVRILDELRGGPVSEDREVERAVEAAARGEPARARLWLSLAAQRRRLGLSARQLLKRSGAEMQALALRGVPDLRLDWLRRVSHAALLAQGAESWTGTLGGHRVHRYAFAGRGADLSDEALGLLPDSFADERTGATRMAELLFHRTPWLFWLVARDFARAWSSPTVQRILDDARNDRDRSLGIDVLSAIRAPVLILWGAQDRLLPATSADHFRRHTPGATVELIPDCGHIPQLERPAYTRRRVREFVEKLKT